MRLTVLTTFFSLFLAFTPGSTGADTGKTARPGFSNWAWGSASLLSEKEKALLRELEEPMVRALDVEEALEHWFAGRAATAAGKTEEAERHWTAGVKAVQKELTPLPKAEWPQPPDSSLEFDEKIDYPGTEGTEIHIVHWQVGELTQYGILILPNGNRPEKGFPLLLYLHGAAFGVPKHALPWLAEMARQGYAIIGPALRGENLFSIGTYSTEGQDYVSEGTIENLDGEVQDAVGAAVAARRLDDIRDGAFAIIGHSFGAGAGLLVTARSEDVACMVSYDAWLTNPFRFYWARMRPGTSYYWGSWEQFCLQPVARQLSELMKRSIVHHAAQVSCPLLLFIGGAYQGSAYHESHADLVAELESYGKNYEYTVVPDAGHNFVLYYDSDAAQHSYRKHMNFLRTHFPPAFNSANGITDPADGTD